MKKLATAVKTRPDLKVFFLLDNPWSEATAPSEENFNPLFHANRIHPEASNYVMTLPHNPKWLDANELVSRFAEGWATVIDPSPYICPNGICNVAEWYRDDDHLQPKALEAKAVWLDPIFKE